MVEIIYPEIPPDGKVGIIIKMIGSGVTKDDLEIRHSKGVARQLSESTDSLSYFYLVLIGIYFVLIISSIRSSFIDRLDHKKYYSPYKSILKKTKPWYVSSNKWEEIRKDAIEHSFNRDYSSIISSSFCYQLLDTPRH